MDLGAVAHPLEAPPPHPFASPPPAQLVRSPAAQVYGLARLQQLARQGGQQGDDEQVRTHRGHGCLQREAAWRPR